MILPYSGWRLNGNSRGKRRDGAVASRESERNLSGGHKMDETDFTWRTGQEVDNVE